MQYSFRLYITGGTPHSLQAIERLKALCEQEIRGQYELEVIDVLEHPELAEDAKILATPTLIKHSPPPLRKIIGDLGEGAGLFQALDLSPSSAPSAASQNGPVVDAQQLLELNPDGIILVDRAGVVLFVNPAGACLLGQDTDQLRGEIFGFPVVGSETTEVCLGGDRVAEMRTIETEWEGKIAFLVALRDITDRKWAERVQLEAERQRVLMESMLAAVHHLSQGLAVMYGNLELLSNSQHLPERESRLIAQCLNGAQQFRENIEKLRNVRDYRTKSYAGGMLMVDIEP